MSSFSSFREADELVSEKNWATTSFGMLPQRESSVSSRPKSGREVREERVESKCDDSSVFSVSSNIGGYFVHDLIERLFFSFSFSRHPEEVGGVSVLGEPKLLPLMAFLTVVEPLFGILMVVNAKKKG